MGRVHSMLFWFTIISQWLGPDSTKIKRYRLVIWLGGWGMGTLHFNFWPFPYKYL